MIDMIVFKTWRANRYCYRFQYEPNLWYSIFMWRDLVRTEGREHK